MRLLIPKKKKHVVKHAGYETELLNSKKKGTIFCCNIGKPVELRNDSVNCSMQSA